MLAQSLLALFALVAVTSVAETTHVQWSLQPDARPHLQVPALTEVRDILARLEAPIISSIVSRAALPAEQELYDYEGYYLLEFINAEEWYGMNSGRYEYGSLEYPITYPPGNPDRTTYHQRFPAGRFHEDTFTPNQNLTSFYLNTFMPAIRSANKDIDSTSSFFHLKNESAIPQPSSDEPSWPSDETAKYTLDYTILSLLSHRASIGKVVAEAKYTANFSAYSPLIKSRDREAIRTLLTNTTQEQAVLVQTASASQSITNAWQTAQGASSDASQAFVTSVQSAVAQVFRNLIDITTEVEIEYLLQRFD